MMMARFDTTDGRWASGEQLFKHGGIKSVTQVWGIVQATVVGSAPGSEQVHQDVLPVQLIFRGLSTDDHRLFEELQPGFTPSQSYLERYNYLSTHSLDVMDGIRWSNLTASCPCDDFKCKPIPGVPVRSKDVPCQHVSAVLHHLAATINKDGRNIFLLRRIDPMEDVWESPTKKARAAPVKTEKFEGDSESQAIELDSDYSSAPSSPDIPSKASPGWFASYNSESQPLEL